MVRVGRDTRCVPSLIKVRVESNLVKVRLDTDRLQDAHAAYQRKAEQPKEGNPSHTSRLLPRKSRSMVAVSTCKRPTPPNACAMGEAHRFLVPLESSQSNRGSRQKKSLHKHKHGRQGRSTRRWAGRSIALTPNPMPRRALGQRRRLYWRKWRNIYPERNLTRRWANVKCARTCGARSNSSENADPPRDRSLISARLSQVFRKLQGARVCR